MQNHDEHNQLIARLVRLAEEIQSSAFIQLLCNTPENELPLGLKSEALTQLKDSRDQLQQNTPSDLQVKLNAHFDIYQTAQDRFGSCLKKINPNQNWDSWILLQDQLLAQKLFKGTWLIELIKGLTLTDDPTNTQNAMAKMAELRADRNPEANFLCQFVRENNKSDDDPLENNLQTLFRKLESLSKSPIIDPENPVAKSFSEFKTKLQAFELIWKKLRIARAELDSQRSDQYESVYKKLMDIGFSQVMAEEMKKQQAKAEEAKNALVREAKDLPPNRDVAIISANLIFIAGPNATESLKGLLNDFKTRQFRVVIDPKSHSSDLVFRQLATILGDDWPSHYPIEIAQPQSKEELSLGEVTQADLASCLSKIPSANLRVIIDESTDRWAELKQDVHVLSLKPNPTLENLLELKSPLNTLFGLIRDSEASREKMVTLLTKHFTDLTIEQMKEYFQTIFTCRKYASMPQGGIMLMAIQLQDERTALRSRIVKVSDWQNPEIQQQYTLHMIKSIIFSDAVMAEVERNLRRGLLPSTPKNIAQRLTSQSDRWNYNLSFFKHFFTGVPECYHFARRLRSQENLAAPLALDAAHKSLMSLFYPNPTKAQQEAQLLWRKLYNFFLRHGLYQAKGDTQQCELRQLFLDVPKPWADDRFSIWTKIDSKKARLQDEHYDQQFRDATPTTRPT